MTFIHGYLLAGLALAGLPVLIHLIMRQKPKVLQFPAFRFLRQKHFINRRRMRLQHLLLLALRMLLIAALCLALARPRVVVSQVASVGSERAVAAVLVFDTSPSMEYAAAGKTRLDEAKERAGELLDQMAPASQLAVLDSGDDAGGDPAGGDWLGPDAARVRIEQLRVRHANGPLTRQVERAFRMLQARADAEADAADPLPRFLFVFSDRTREAWDAAAAKQLKRPDSVNVLFIDVGVDAPRDLAIDKVEVEPAVVAPGARLRLKVTVRSTGADHDTKLTGQLDNEPDVNRPVEERHVALGKGQGQLIVIERPAPALPEGTVEATFQATVRLASNDALPFNNSRFATFLVREPHKLLTVADRPADAHLWKTALDVLGAFKCDVRTPEEAEKLTDKELAGYRVACLFQVARPSPLLWDRLRGLVQAGGGLVLVPGGDEFSPSREDYNAEGTKRGLLPARFESLVRVPAGRPEVAWSGFNAQHPLTAPFQEWTRTTTADFTTPELQPLVNAFWAVKPVDESAVVITRYAEDGRSPILVERLLGQGRVIQFTTPMDGRWLDAKRTRPWTNYWQGSFGLVLTDKVTRYLAGESAPPELNFFCGQAALVAMPANATPPLKLAGPNLTAAETNLAVPEAGARLPVPQAATPGNFTVQDGKGKTLTGFSMNVRPEESVLERVPVEEVEEALGKSSVLPIGRRTSLEEALAGHWAPPIELMPWLMLALLVGLTAESFLANRFYRKEAGA
jgi:hypothetical protein